jgi:hypothetical protein
MNHVKRSTDAGGGEMKRDTSGAVRIGSSVDASLTCTSRSRQCSPVSTGTASRHETGNAGAGPGLTA